MFFKFLLVASLLLNLVLTALSADRDADTTKGAYLITTVVLVVMGIGYGLISQFVLS